MSLAVTSAAELALAEPSACADADMEAVPLPAAGLSALLAGQPPQPAKRRAAQRRAAALRKDE